MGYKVIPLMDDIYQVVDTVTYQNVYYQGRLADCEAWIRLSNEGYL